jgi:hypothetical protein
MAQERIKAGGYKWREKMTNSRNALRRQRQLIADHLNGRIDEDLLLTALLTLNTQADEALQDIEREYGR